MDGVLTEFYLFQISVTLITIFSLPKVDSIVLFFEISDNLRANVLLWDLVDCDWCLF